jgi:ABC-type siderophore export system fused ATPase/permease subunit
VLDEFAADQDPLFRRKFYTEILEYIRAEGFSVVAITHDDAYHDCADTIYYMDYGSLRTMKHKELASLYSLS